MTPVGAGYDKMPDTDEALSCILMSIRSCLELQNISSSFSFAVNS